MIKKCGFYWHCHHDILLEWCYDYDERAEFIKQNKPQDEIEERLRVFRPVKGKLPIEIITAYEAYDKVYEANSKVYEAYNKAREACAYSKAYEANSKAREANSKAREANSKAREACDKAGKACSKAMEACDKAGKACSKAMVANHTIIEKLHAKECPDCSWNGKRLVFKPKEQR